jgi:hypothetical protein
MSELNQLSFWLKFCYMMFWNLVCLVLDEWSWTLYIVFFKKLNWTA